MSYQSAIADLEQIIFNAASSITTVNSSSDGYDKLDLAQLIALAKDTIAQTAGDKKFHNSFKLARIVGGSNINRLDALLSNEERLHYANISPNISDNQKTNTITIGFAEYGQIKLYHFKHDKEKNIIVGCKLQEHFKVIESHGTFQTDRYAMSIQDIDIVSLRQLFVPVQPQN